ncbi:stage V sporulation protein AE [Clostridium tertium]|jgi:stage V sporulation protein AE|uniref:Stage V sporulation protein AE n=1 Tax=Clostridium tertium TaxID=1559 RepID=A0A9X4B0J5_9CLOT|nr:MULTISPECIES: stage V sporulation protein AE [Clostridium]EEH98671.1 stage V sporulation protein AE [Clostridium sp. 7_2_43FAA]MBU6136654.1 stage V sporulation protein AE [Clostridium tertium]MDB1941970.1 stage V sporulation protein AE [Clostridium tertium]MDB1946762.1 stage V sporulation protein AE [Clostridium tertium]MDB1954519.1 stage V sporulation protein AE [Clostridium tertium]
MEKFIFAFIIGGIICVIGQLIMDTLKITPAHTTCTLVVVGAILGGFGLYDPLVKFAGAGAFVPISSFGNTLVTAAINEAQQTGFLGIFSGLLKTVSAGVSSAIIFGFFAAIIFKPKG